MYGVVRRRPGTRGGMMHSKRVWAMAVAMIALSVAAAAAQAGYPGGYPGGRTGSGEGARPERSGGERRRIITASQLEGPPEPGFAAARFEFDSTEAAAYKQAYDSFMMATQPQRDKSLQGLSAVEAAAAARRGTTPIGGPGGTGALNPSQKHAAPGCPGAALATWGAVVVTTSRHAAPPGPSGPERLQTRRAAPRSTT